ncbi:equilibrative nucleobase transporter 1-like [Argiope bruennichi]|uniref:equilibrative nucleobase transporter 1-like n=1 Tax=Argiope bruennichi TaxID=94029 RepID=UPI0024940781|nr:equilibrative nucleobase transporter 1-like [Argiope bruennichi]
MRQITRQFILWYGLFETFVFTGNIFGWTALHYMLRQEGIYEHVCEPQFHNDTSLNANVTNVPSYNLKGYRMCESQDSILNLAYTIGSFCMGSTSFVWGFLLDKWGLRNVRLIINGLITSGCILLSLTIKETSFLLFPSLILMCVAGVPLRLANMQIADLFPEQRSTVITLYSGAFSASASVFVFIKYGFDAGLPWEWACFLLVVLSALMLPVTLFVLPADRFGTEKGGLFTGKEKEVSSVAPCVWGTYTYIGDEPPYHRTTTIEKKEVKGKSMQAATSEKEKREEIPLRRSLLSVSFLLHQYWFCWILLYTIIYVGTLHLWAERTTTDRSEDAFFSEIYGIFQISGIFLAPIGGIFMDWSIRRVSKSENLDPSDHMLKVLRSCFWPMFLTTLLEVVAQVCKFFNLRSAIYVSIVSVTLLRAFFISIGTAYLRIRFPAEHFNRLLGIMSTCSAMFCLFQFPLFLWESSSRQNVLYVNIFDSVCLAIAMIQPLLLVATPIQRYFLKEKSSS